VSRSCHLGNRGPRARGRASYRGYKLDLPYATDARSVDTVDNRTEIRDFLATRRAKLTPEQVGLPTSGRRRVPGLRREEVAVPTGVSPDWYIRLEKGHISGVSDAVLDAVARALQLNDAERESPRVRAGGNSAGGRSRYDVLPSSIPRVAP